jgi:hypothetical protein
VKTAYKVLVEKLTYSYGTGEGDAYMRIILKWVSGE